MLQEWEVQNPNGTASTVQRERAPIYPGFSTWTPGSHTLTRCDWLSFPIISPFCLNKIKPNPIQLYTVGTDKKYKITNNKQF